MTFKQLFDDDDAVSPVIGVILMVAITVILAAVIATFVLGLGEQISDTAPQASFNYEYNETGTNVTVTHTGGQTLDNSSIRIGGNNGGIVAQWGVDKIGAGDQVVVDANRTAGDTVQVIWESSDGDQSAVLSEW